MEQQDRIGRFYLEPRGKRGTFQIQWTDESGTPRRASTGTADRGEARVALYEFALKNGATVTGEAPKGAIKDPPLADVLLNYWDSHAKNLPSSDATRAMMRDVTRVWGAVRVSDIDLPKQLQLIKVLRAGDDEHKGLADSTIVRRFNDLFAALYFGHECKLLSQVPARVSAERWKPNLDTDTRALEIDELGALFAAASDDDDQRYERAHWWKFLVLAVATASRRTALLQLRWSQIDLANNVIHLNPPGRRQTKKRRPTLPICPTLAAELATWDRDSEYVLHYYGKPITSDTFIDNLFKQAGVEQASAHTIRHTVRTWLTGKAVEANIDAFMGHKGQGSATGAKYTHLRPDYLRDVIEALEALFAAVAPHVSRPFAGSVLDDQPLPSDGFVVRVLANHYPTAISGTRKSLKVERETRLELATSTLARSTSV